MKTVLERRTRPEEATAAAVDEQTVLLREIRDALAPTRPGTDDGPSVT